MSASAGTTPAVSRSQAGRRGSTAAGRGDERVVAGERRRRVAHLAIGPVERDGRQASLETRRGRVDRVELRGACLDGRRDALGVAGHEGGQCGSALVAEHADGVGEGQQVGRGRVEIAGDGPVGDRGQLGPPGPAGQVIDRGHDPGGAEGEDQGGGEPAGGDRRAAEHRTSRPPRRRD